jgi:hypothetical protein
MNKVEEESGQIKRKGEEAEEIAGGNEREKEVCENQKKKRNKEIRNNIDVYVVSIPELSRIVSL